MRQLLKNNPFPTSKFSTLKNIIRRKSKEMEEYEKIQGLQFEKHIRELIMNEDSKEKKLNRLNQTYDKICLTSARPLETLLTEFLNHSNHFEENDIVRMTVYMGRAFQLSLTDHQGHLDRFGHKLYQSPMWEHFVEELKYALSDKAYMQNKNITDVLNSLCELNYLDEEILKLVMVKIEKILNLSSEESIGYEARPFQIQKAGYYKHKIIHYDKAILENETFQKNIQYFQRKRKEFAAEETFENVKKDDFETDENFNVVSELVSQFKKFNQGTSGLIEGVIAIRQQYLRMVTISRNQSVMRNPELNEKTLDIEQKLLELHLISLEDIQNPEIIADKEKQLSRVDQTVKLLMSEADIDNFEDYFVEEKKNLNYLQQRKQRNLLEISKLIEAFTRYANIPHKLHGTDNRVSLLNSRWQRYFLQNNFYDNNIQVERLFRKGFGESQTFLKKIIKNLEQHMYEANLKAKVHYFSALINLGFEQEIHEQFKSIKLTLDSISCFEHQNILALVKVLNNVYQDKYIVSPQVQEFIQQKLIEIYEVKRELFNIETLCDTINYLYQIQNRKSSKENVINKEFYTRLVNLLASEVQYVQRNSAVSCFVVKQAKRILEFEQPENGETSNIYTQLNEVEQLYSKYGNPFIKVLYETFGIQNKGDQYKVPYVITGVNDNNQISGLYFANSDNSSSTGKYVSGHINAYCLRLFTKNGIRITPLPLNRFLDIKFADNKGFTLGHQAQIKMKESNEILGLIAEHLPKNNSSLLEFFKIFAQHLEKLPNNPESSIKFRKLLSSFKKIITLYNEEKHVYFINQFYAKRCILLAHVELLKRDLKLFTNEQKEEMSKLWSDEVKTPSLEAALDNVEKQLSKKLSNIQKSFSDLDTRQKEKKINFIGKRLTLNLIGEETNSEVSALVHPEIQFLSLPFLNDFRYVEYGDWQIKLKQIANYHEIKLDQASKIVQFLTMKFCPQVKETIVASPSENGDLLVPFFPVNWENKYRYHSRNAEDKDSLEQISVQYRENFKNKHQKNMKMDHSIIALQNMKHKLKISKTPKQILQILVNLDLVKNLQNNQQNAENVHYVERNPEEYFKYLQRKADKMYLESPYLEFLFNRIEQTEELKQNILERKRSKAQLNLLFNQGSINRKQYFDSVRQVDEKLIKQMEKLKQKSLTHVEGLQTGEDGSKIVQLNKDIEDLQRIIKTAVHYDRYEDSDLLLAKGDFSKALEFKRARAEKNLVLFSLFYKISQKTDFSTSEKAFLQNWKKDVIAGISEHKGSNKFTKIGINSISKNDRKNLYLNEESKTSNIALSDVILQISHFFDENVISRLESEIITSHFAKKYGIPEYVFSSTCKKSFDKTAYEIQDCIFEQNYQLNEKELETIIHLTKIFKTEGLSDRYRYQEHYGQIEKNLDLINKCRYRDPLIFQFLKQKDFEYYNEFNPKDARDAKVRQVNNLRKKVFKSSNKPVNSEMISERVDELCQNMLYFKIETPPYFSYLVLDILTNENTDIFTKQKLLAYIELFKIPFKLDSEDLLSLAVPAQIETEKLKQSLKKLSEISMTGHISTYL